MKFLILYNTAKKKGKKCGKKHKSVLFSESLRERRTAVAVKKRREGSP